MNESTLQEQFNELQREQNKRLARLKQKQAKQSISKENTSSFTSYGVSDNLNLSTEDVMSSSTVGLNIALEEANTTMRQELRELQDETGRLRKVLAEREYEIKRLNKKILKCEDEKRMLSDAGIASDSASTKIVDLSKKNRDLTSQLESEKSKSFRLQQKVHDLEGKLSRQTHGDADEIPKLSKTSSLHHSQNNPVATAESVESLQEQLSHTNAKVAEHRNQLQVLRQDMKVAFKVLSQETGESQVNLQALLSNGGQGYRGRAQQVIALQGKVKELEQKLKSDLDLNPKVDKNLMRIKNIERSRKEQNDALKEDLVKLQEQYTDLQRKFEASKARNKVLTSEVKAHKAQISVLTEKGTHDNELIGTLMRQQDRMQKLLERSAYSKARDATSETQVHLQLNDQKQRESSEIKRLKELLAERDETVRRLEEQVKDTDSLDGDHHQPLSVFTPVQVNDVSEETRSSLARCDEEVPQLKQKYVEATTMYQVSEAERKRLVGILTSVNANVEEAVRNTEQTISAYHEEKRKCASLEQKLEALKLTLKPDELQPQKSEEFGGLVKELQSRLLIQEDENHALKEALESTLQSKSSEVAMYQEMAEQTKQVFLDALRSLKSS